jgi:uncharacterized protein YbjT (DUF2867 family)
MPRTALLAGATGLVGRHVLELLLEGADVAHVHALGRRSLDASHAKLTSHVVDFDKLDVDVGAVDDVYLCLGTTIKVAGSQERFRKVDHDYSVAVARLGHERGAGRVALVSSVGASAGASSFYLRVKGETEQSLEALAYSTRVIARPSLLLGERSEKRTGEKIGIGVARALSFALVGGLRTYRPVDAKSVALAMIAAVRAGAPGTRVLDYDSIVTLSADGPPL